MDTTTRGSTDEAVVAVHARIDRWLEFVRKQLDMDVAFVSELVDGTQVIRHLSGARSTGGWRPGTTIPEADGYCTYVVSGSLPSVIRDARNHEIAAALRATVDADIGSYIGAPIRLPDGTVFGALCATSPSPNHELGDPQVDLLTFLAGILGQELAELERLLVDQEVRHAKVRDIIARSDFDAAFQPIVDIASGKVGGVEVLARFPAYPEGWSEVSAMADEPALLIELELTLARAAIGRVTSGGRPPCRISVNVSPETLMSAALVELLSEQHDVDLTLEITEYAALADTPELRDQLAVLRGLGARIAIDDTGSGYAGFNMLVVVRPDTIKVDLALIRHIEADPVRRALLRSIVSFGREVDAVVVAEGIETVDELHAVRATGCDMGQGFLIQRPTHDFALACRDVILPA